MKKSKIERAVYKSASGNDLDEAYQRLHFLEKPESKQKTLALLQESYEKRFNFYQTV